MTEQTQPATDKSIWEQLQLFLTKDNLQKLANEVNQLYTAGHFLPSQACRAIEGVNALANIVGITDFKAVPHPEAFRLWRDSGRAPFNKPVTEHGAPIGAETDYDEYEEDYYDDRDGDNT